MVLTDCSSPAHGPQLHRHRIVRPQPDADIRIVSFLAPLTPPLPTEGAFTDPDSTDPSVTN
eukprot:3979929-Pyramimonas_sp.AAC.1